MCRQGNGHGSLVLTERKGANTAKQRMLYARPVVVYLCSIPWASPSAAPSFSCFAGDAAASDIAGSCLSDTLDDLDVVLTSQGVPIRFPDCIDG